MRMDGVEEGSGMEMDATYLTWVRARSWPESKMGLMVGGYMGGQDRETETQPDRQADRQNRSSNSRQSILREILAPTDSKAG